MIISIPPKGIVPPPPGVKPNFDDPNSMGPAIIATVTICIVLTTLFTAARLLAKRSFSPWTIEDYTLLLAWACNIALNAVLIIEGRSGMGLHVWDEPYYNLVQLARASLPSWQINYDHITDLSQLGWIFQLLYCPFVWFAKAAVLVMFMRIFAPNKSGPVYWTIHALIWGNLALYVALIFAVAFECTPVSRAWNPNVTSGFCIEMNMILVVQGAFNVFSNLLILLLPIWAIWHLHLETKRKLGIIAVFAIGVGAVVCSICRMIYIVRFSFLNADSTYVIAQVMLWTVAEIAAIILCTCFPMMPRLYLWARNKHYGPQISTPHGYVHRNNTRSPILSHGSSGSGLLANGGKKVVTRSENEYMQIREHATRPAAWWDKYNGPGIQKTVSIELTRQDATSIERSSFGAV